MKIIIANKATFSSKTGVEYVKASFISPINGATGELFLSKKEFDSYGVEILDSQFSKELVDSLKGLPTLEVEFDQKGRVVSLKQ